MHIDKPQSSWQNVDDTKLWLFGKSHQLWSKKEVCCLGLSPRSWNKDTKHPRLLEVSSCWKSNDPAQKIMWNHWQICSILQNVTMTLNEFTPPLQVCCFHANAAPCLAAFLWATENTKLPRQLVQHREEACIQACQSKGKKKEIPWITLKAFSKSFSFTFVFIFHGLE